MPGLNAFLPLVILAGLFMRGCEETAPVQQGPESIGDVENGMALIEAAGCGSCHIIPGIENARGLVGPR
jgi:cytochrome c